jgi:UDP-N-acetylglucosamine 2-epimerase
MKIASIVGARPEFIQAYPVSQVLQKKHNEILIHTGQHYDYKMSQTFFDELGLPDPHYNLEVGSGTHAVQTAQILIRLEEVLESENPDVVIIRGDTNSTLAAAVVASKLNIPLVHIEAGERSYNRRMPEEINRLVADSLSDLHLCASQAAVQRLAAEGFVKTVRWVGDVMYDVMLHIKPIAQRKSNILNQLGLAEQQFSLVTIHRSDNTDDPRRLREIIRALNYINEPIVFPIHPRTRKALEELNIQLNKNILAIDPVGYFDMVSLEMNARLIATDSGGVQREAYFHGIPCLTLRDETEWVETVNVGWNIIVGANFDNITDSWFSFKPPQQQPAIFGNGHAGSEIVTTIEKWDFATQNEHIFFNSLPQISSMEQKQ